MALELTPFRIVLFCCFNLVLVRFLTVYYGSSHEMEENSSRELIELKLNKERANFCVYGIKTFSSEISSRYHFLCGNQEEPKLIECPKGNIYSPKKESCVKDNEGKDKKPIDTLALGRNFQLGNFYDARNNRFFPDASLWTKETIDKNAEVNDQKEVNLKFTADKTAKEKMTHVDISASLAMDFLSGLIHVSGSASYLKDTVDVDNEVNVEMRYHTTKFVKTLSRMVTKDYPKLCTNKDFTHVVTSVVYGLDAVFNFKRRLHHHESEEDIKGTLGISITKIPAFSISGKGAADLSDKEQQVMNSTSLVMYGDFSPDEVLPTTFEEAVLFFKQLPLLTGTDENHWKGSSKLSLHMTPITDVCDGVDYILNDISDSVLSTTANILDKLEQLSMKIGGLLSKDPARKFIPLRRNLILYSTQLENYRSNVTLQLQNFIPSIRGGNTHGEKDILKLIMAYRDSQFEFDTSSLFLVNRNREIKAISMLTENFPERSNIAAIDYESANDVKYIFERDFVVVMKFHILTPKNLTEDFLAGHFEDESNFWYNTEDINGLVGHELRKFRDFSLANVDMEDRAYLINLLPLKIDEPMNVVAFIKGQVLTENFTVPIPPELPEIYEITHDSFSFKIPKAKDNQFVTGFSIIIESLIDNSTIIHDFVFSKEIVTTTGLKPAHPYTFSIRFLTKVGSTFPSSKKKQFTTAPSSPPQNLKAKDITQNSLDLFWAPPAIIGEGINQSELLYNLSLTGDDGLALEILTPHTEASFGSLSDATNYQVEVKAIIRKTNTSIPMYESLPTKIKSIFSSPLAPTILPALPTEVELHAVTVRWVKPQKLGKDAEVLHYVLEYSAMNENGSEQIPGTRHQLVINKTFCDVTGLAQGQLYSFKAKIATTLGESSFGNSIIQKTNFNRTKYEGLVESLPPLGSILPWTGKHTTGADVPAGWQRCDGSVIEQGPLTGQRTPDLNNKDLFLRGGSDQAAGTVEEDAVEEHSHEDHGHTHQDSGHAHTQQAHSHMIDSSGTHHPDTVGATSCSKFQTKVYYYVNKGGSYYCLNWNWDTAQSRPAINRASASIRTSKAGIGGVSGGKSASETRPKNMRIVFIMRIV